MKNKSIIRIKCAYNNFGDEEIKYIVDTQYHIMPIYSVTHAFKMFWCDIQLSR